MAPSEIVALSAAERHRLVAQRFGQVVDGVTAWDSPTPVSGWAARDVVTHLLDWLPGMLAGGGVDLASTSSDDLAEAWRSRSADVQRLFDDGNREFTHQHIGTMPLADALDRFYATDVSMHTWDLARATGQDDRLDEDYCAHLLTGMEPMDELLRASGQYGPAVPVPAGASAQDRMLGFIGRDPQWRPAGNA